MREHPAGLSDSYDFDHTSIAVGDLGIWTRYVTTKLEAVLVGQADNPEFRYRSLVTGRDQSGARLELLAPPANSPSGFVSRFLDRRGTGPHHLTFIVEDVIETAEQVRRLGLEIVGMNLCDASWREAFIPPDELHGTLIQIADSIGGVVDREDGKLFSAMRSGLLSTTLYSSDIARSATLFGQVLRGSVTVQREGADFEWRSGVLKVRCGRPAGIGPLEFDTESPDHLRIGSTVFVRHEPAVTPARR